MLKQNRWTHGATHLVLPPLPLGMQGKQGCTLQRAVFDPKVGEEVYVSLREAPGYAEQYADIHPLRMLATTGAMRTPDGVVGFIVWQVAVGTPQELAMDHYVNPQEMNTLRLLADAGNQTHLKLVIMNNQTSAVTAFVDFENVFELGSFAGTLVEFIGHEPVGDFIAASQFVMDHMTVPDLLNLGEGAGR